MPASALPTPLEDPVIRGCFSRYAQSLYFQAARTAACNGAHDLEQRLTRWLLLARHRTRSDELPLTHELLSMMLAVRRAGVTVAARTLQEAGLIQYRRGHITVLDTAGLEEVSCECLRMITG